MLRHIQLRHQAQRQSGFTLIELMIVVGILAIIAAIAFPSYQNQVRKTRRAEAKTALAMGAQNLERCFTETNNYTACPGASTIAGQPQDYYDFSFSVISTSAFTLQAVASTRGNQIADSDCKTFTISSTGKKEAKDSSGTLTAYGDCW